MGIQASMYGLALCFLIVGLVLHSLMRGEMDIQASIYDLALRNLSIGEMDIQTSIHGQTEFALEFSKLVLEASMGQNAVFSPLSISVTMSMAATGSKGPTLDQFRTCLKLKEAPQFYEFASQLAYVVLADGNPRRGPHLSFINGVWVDKSMPLKPSFGDIVKKHYNAEARMVDFLNKWNEVRMEINKWAADETKGKIQEPLPADSVDQYTRLVLANALYFKGTWQREFDSSATKRGTFNLLNGETVQVPMMTTKKKQFIKRVGDCQILCLPYVQGNDKRSFSMYFLLPDKKDGLPDLEKTMDLNFFENHLSRGHEVEVGSFHLPRFKISFSFEAQEFLEKLGLVLPFSNGADFTEMVDSPVAKSLHISNVFHSSFVEVNEKGTEAAAVTVGVFPQCYNPPVDFIADHPFMFMIKEDKSGVILFVGHIWNPLNN